MFAPTPPATWNGLYYDNRWLTGAAQLDRQDAALDFAWGAGSPDPVLPTDSFSARWTRTFDVADSGFHQFTLNAQGGVRAWLDWRLLVDDWLSETVTWEDVVGMEAGAHTLTVEYNNATGDAGIRLTWGLAPSPPHTATVTPTATQTGTPTATATVTPTATDTPEPQRLFLPLVIKP